jgi:GAG-pre-integrase domain
MDSTQKKNSGEGLYTRGRSIKRGKIDNSRPRSKSQHKNLVYNYCKKKGHIKKNCFKLQNKLKYGGVNPKEDDSGNANIATDQSDFALFAEENSEIENSTALLVAKGLENRREEWTIDSTCSFHITPHKYWFNFYNPVSEGVVFMGNENSYKIEGISTVQVRTRDGLVRTLSDVRHVLGMKRNLISLSALEDKGCSFSGKDGVLKVFHRQLVVLKGIRKGNLYILEGDTIVGHAAVAETTNDMKLWHMRLGHMSDWGLIELSNQGFFGKYNISKVGFCDHCLFGKQKRATFNTPAMHVTKGILDYIHADVWGPSREASLSGARYMVTFINDYSRKVWVYFLKHKYEAFDAFKSWKVMIEKQIEREIKN